MSKIKTVSKPKLSFHREAGEHKAHYLVTADVNDLTYQKRFSYKPEQKEMLSAVDGFKENYRGLNDSTNKPVEVKQHHSEL